MEDCINRKRTVFFIGNIILMLTAFIFSVYNILFGDQLLGTILGGIGVIFLILNIAVLQNCKFLKPASWILVVLTALFFLYAMFSKKLDAGSIAWVVAPYFLAMFLLGLHNGTIVCSIYGYGILMSMMYRYAAGDAALSVITMISVAIANIFAFAFAAYYEKARAENEEELLRKNREVEIMSNHDGLTGIFNRRYFDWLLSKEFYRAKREKQPLALVIGDIDLFKNYNDTFGHLQGDACLVQVADAINQSITRAADSVMRYGGEEFAVLLPNTNAKGAMTVAKRIQENTTAKAIPHPLSDVADIVTLSLGVSVILHDEDQEPSDLVQRADRALYISKSQGRGRITVI